MPHSTQHRELSDCIFLAQVSSPEKFGIGQDRYQLSLYSALMLLFDSEHQNEANAFQFFVSKSVRFLSKPTNPLLSRARSMLHSEIFVHMYLLSCSDMNGE